MIFCLVYFLFFQIFAFPQPQRLERYLAHSMILDNLYFKKERFYCAMYPSPPPLQSSIVSRRRLLFTFQTVGSEAIATLSTSAIIFQIKSSGIQKK